MSGFYSRLYEIAKASKHQKEDFLTELFAQSLREPEVASAWLDSLSILTLEESHPEKWHIVTQNHYEIDGETQEGFDESRDAGMKQRGKRRRPDIEMSSRSVLILVENKVDAFAHRGQLDDYWAILDREKGQKASCLIYVTDRYDPQPFTSPLFKQTRWRDVYTARSYAV